MKLKDKVALVTGAGSGFGEGIAKLFAAEGAKIVVNDVSAASGSRVAEEIARARGEAIFLNADVSKGDDVAGLAKAALDRFGRIDILINNAGVTHTNRPLTEVDEATFDHIFAVNVKSIYLTARAFVPAMKKAGGGVILNVASTAGVRPRPGLTWYNGSKGAVITFTRSMAVELAPDKIRVVAINPVMGETGLLEQFMGGADSPERRAKFVATIPLGRLSTPADIAKTALFLVSSDAEFLTGVCVEVDGGRCV
jgi:3-oxoacyl-[acyl-carrier protein] reductase